MSGDRCQGQANWSQTSPSAPGDLWEPWGNFENYRERNWDYPEQNWAFVNKQICAFLRILFMSTALATKWKWGIVYTNTGKSLASILLGKGFLVKKDIQYKPCCEKSQSVNKQTDQRKDKVTLSPSTGSVRKLFITFIIMVGKEGVGVGRGGGLLCSIKKFTDFILCSLSWTICEEPFLPKISIATEKNSIVTAKLLIATDKTRSLVLKYQLSFITSDWYLSLSECVAVELNRQDNQTYNPEKKITDKLK